MATPVGVNDGFVSNDSDSEIRETSAHASAMERGLFYTYGTLAIVNTK